VGRPASRTARLQRPCGGASIIVLENSIDPGVPWDFGLRRAGSAHCRGSVSRRQKTARFLGVHPPPPANSAGKPLLFSPACSGPCHGGGERSGTKPEKLYGKTAPQKRWQAKCSRKRSRAGLFVGRHFSCPAGPELEPCCAPGRRGHRGCPVAGTATRFCERHLLGPRAHVNGPLAAADPLSQSTSGLSRAAFGPAAIFQTGSRRLFPDFSRIRRTPDWPSLAEPAAGTAGCSGGGDLAVLGPARAARSRVPLDVRKLGKRCAARIRQMNHIYGRCGSGGMHSNPPRGFQPIVQLHWPFEIRAPPDNSTAESGGPRKSGRVD